MTLNLSDEIKVKEVYEQKIKKLIERMEDDYTNVNIIWQKNWYVLPYPLIILDKPFKDIVVNDILPWEDLIFIFKKEIELDKMEDKNLKFLYVYAMGVYPNNFGVKPFWKDENDDYLKIENFYDTDYNKEIGNLVELEDWIKKIIKDFSKEQNIKEIKETNIVNMGISVWGQRNILIPAENYKHFAIVWWTWSGKSVKTKEILLQLFQQNSKIVLVDKDGNDYSDIFSNYYDKFLFYSSKDFVKSKEKFLIFILFLKILQGVRKEEIAKSGESDFREVLLKNPKLERILIIFDEFQTLRSDIKSLDDSYLKIFDTFVEDILQTGRSAWITMIISTQNVNQSAFPEKARTNLNFILWKVSNAKAYSFLNVGDETVKVLEKNNTFLFYDKNQNSFLAGNNVNIKKQELDDKIKNEKENIMLALQGALEEFSSSSNFKSTLLANIMKRFYSFDFTDIEIEILKKEPLFYILAYYLFKIEEQIEITLGNFRNWTSSLSSLKIVGNAFKNISKASFKNNIDTLIENMFYYYCFIDTYSPFKAIFTDTQLKIQSVVMDFLKTMKDDDGDDNILLEMLDKIEETIRTNIRLGIKQRFKEYFEDNNDFKDDNLNNSEIEEDNSLNDSEIEKDDEIEEDDVLKDNKIEENDKIEENNVLNNNEIEEDDEIVENNSLKDNGIEEDDEKIKIKIR